MQNTENGTKTNNSSLVQKIKTFLFGQDGPVHYHTHVHTTVSHTHKTVRMSELSPKAQQSFDNLFNDLFSNNQPLNQ